MTMECRARPKSEAQNSTWVCHVGGRAQELKPSKVASQNTPSRQPDSKQSSQDLNMVLQYMIHWKLRQWCNLLYHNI